MCDKICPAKQALLNRLRTLYYFAQVDGEKQVKAERHIRDLTGELQAAYGAIISLSADNASLAAQLAEVEEDSLSVAVVSGTVLDADAGTLFSPDELTANGSELRPTTSVFPEVKSDVMIGSRQGMTFNMWYDILYPNPTD